MKAFSATVVFTNSAIMLEATRKELKAEKYNNRPRKNIWEATRKELKDAMSSMNSSTFLSHEATRKELKVETRLSLTIISRRLEATRKELKDDHGTLTG